MRIVLLGAGHAHLDVIRRAGPMVRRGHDVTVVSPGGTFWYSGLATGMLGGQCPPADDTVDVGQLCWDAGADHRDARAVGLDPTAKRVRLDDGHPDVAYDVLSVDLGSVVRPLPGQPEGNDAAIAAGVFSIKPIANLAAIRRRVESLRSDGRPARVVVAGGGYSGCEIALNLVRLTRGRAAVALVASADRVLSNLPTLDAAWRVGDLLRSRGVDVRTGTRVERADGDHAVLDTGDRLPFDVLVNATGLHPPPVLADFGLPRDGHGGMIVNDCLQSVASPAVFAGGDCASFHGDPLPRNGVFAIREAPVLRHNLLAAAERRRLRRYRPQSNYLLVLNLADGTGLGVRGDRAYRGRAALWLKTWLDHRFLAKFGGAWGGA